jgi:hypothetical protein
VTLTLKRNDDALSARLTYLSQSFSKLRRRQFWSRGVRGGVRFLDLNGSLQSSWHPHFHVLAESSNLDANGLAELWQQITGDSNQVHVLSVASDIQERERQIAYAAKPPQKDFQDDSCLMRGFERATRHRRFADVFGAWRGVCILKPRKRSKR